MSTHLHVDDLLGRIDRKRLGACNALEAADFGYWSWDLSDGFEWSPRTCELFGVATTQVPRTLVDFLALLDEESQERFLDATETSQKQGTRFCVILRTDKITSKAKQIKLIGQPLMPAGSRDQELTALCMPASASDFDNFYQKQNNFTQSWRELIEVSSDLCVEVDFEGRVLKVNPALERCLGYSDKEMEGRFLYDFIHPADISRTREKNSIILANLTDRPVTNVNSNFENRYRQRDGGYRWFSWSWMADPIERRIYGIARDISETKLLQRRQKEALEQLTRSNQDLQNFASVASHDLREPLRMITGYLRLLQDRSPDALDEKGRKFINYACEGADRMRRLIEDLLAYSRMEHSVLETKRIDLNQILQQARDNLTPTIQSKQAEFVLDLPEEMIVRGDAIRLTRLFQNLLSNAMKFQAEGNRPHIHVKGESNECSMGEPGWWISIEDNGIGIDPDHGELLFQLFQRLNTRDEYEGSGIGLAVCKRVVEMHRGRIWFESSPRKGSTFHVWLKKESSHGEEVDMS